MVSVASSRLPLVAAGHPSRLAPKPLGASDIRPMTGRTSRRGRGAEVGSGNPVAELIGLGIPEARHHLHLLGPTGTGKSTLLLRLILADAKAGRGVVVLDPHGDLALRVLERLPASCRDRLVVIDPEETLAPASWNVLDPSLVGAELVSEHLVATLHRLYAPWWGPRLEDTLRAACLTLTHPATPVPNPATLVPNEEPQLLHELGNSLANRLPNGETALGDQQAQAGAATLADIPRLLTDRVFRDRITAGVRSVDPGGLGAFWAGYEALSPAQMANVGGPVLSKLRAITSRRFALDLLGVAPSTLDLAQILDGGILIARLPKGILGEDTTRLIGSLLLTGVWQAATARTRQPEPARLDASVVVDECHNFLHLPIGLDDALAEARSYRLSWTLAHQHLGQLPRPMAAAIEANTRNKVYFTLSPADAHVLARHTMPHLDEDDLTGLDGYQIACRLMAGSRPARPFTLTTLPPPPEVPGALEAARTAARAHGLTPQARAEHHALRRRLTVPGASPGGRFPSPSAAGWADSPSRSLSASLSASPSLEMESEPDTQVSPSVQVSPNTRDGRGFATGYPTPGRRQ